MAIITLNISSPIRLILVSFYEKDEGVNRFVETFKKNLNTEETIVEEVKFGKIHELGKYFRKIRNNRDNKDYNTIMLVTHGKSNGEQTWEEVEKDRKRKGEENPFDQIVNHPFFLSEILHDAAEDCLVIFAMCYSGKDQIVDLLTRGKAQALHIITSYPQKTLNVVDGAKAIALFFNELVKKEVSEYTPSILEKAFERTNKEFPKILKFWSYGETIAS